MRTLHFMKHKIPCSLLMLCVLVTSASAQLLQLENSFRNISSEQGIPADPAIVVPFRTASQWESTSFFGGWVAHRIEDGSGGILAGAANLTAGATGAITNPSFTPLEGDGVTPILSEQIQLTNVKIGRSIVQRSITFSLGNEITPPERREDGTPLDFNNVADAQYYLSKPQNADTGNYYYSPHADKVFANQPGTVVVDWEIRATGAVFSHTYTVSGSSSKPTKTIFWTEGNYNGPLIPVSDSGVGDVNIVYTTNFPESVEVYESVDFNPENPPDELPPIVTPQNPLDPPGTLPIQTRTMWLDDLDDSIHAYNIEGRVFVELLGDLKEPERLYREHLGFEIVDVVAEARPDELKVAVGDRVYPVDESALTTPLSALDPKIISGLTPDAFVYEHLAQGGTQRQLYAIEETTPIVVLDINGDGELTSADEQQSNEVLIYWMESGVMQLEWPRIYAGYIFKWPEEYLAGEATEQDYRDLYSVYARENNGEDSEATGVSLNQANNPTIVYQDDPTGQHAYLTPNGIFYTVIGQGSRTLIRYQDGDQVWFERVYSYESDDFSGYTSNTPVFVGERIEAPSDNYHIAGFVRETSGNAYSVSAYKNPFVVGFDQASEGSIIPVNALAGNDKLEVWWYEPNSPPADTNFTPTLWPSEVRTYQLSWKSTDENDATLYDEIVMARNDGSGPLGVAEAGVIYRQPDPTQPGYNPNEEHAMLSGGVAWAIRDDLNVANSSKPYVLIEYTAEDDRPSIVTYRVVRENIAHTFEYEAPVGVILQAPMPLPFIELPLDPISGLVRNAETGAQTDVPSSYATGLGYDHYDQFTFNDRKGSTWIYRGPHEEGVNVGSVTDSSKNFQMSYYYKTQAEFDFPDNFGVNAAPSLGTIVPYLRPLVDPLDPSSGYVGDTVAGDPLPVTFVPVWPSNPPVLGVAETLALPKRGLPAMRGQTSAEVLFEQSVSLSMDPNPITGIVTPVKSADLFDPTRAKIYPFSATTLEALPASLDTSLYLGKVYFPQLPPHLSQRLFYDPTIGEFGALVFQGEFVDEVLGEDYFLLNVMSAEDITSAQDLVAVGDTDETAWNNAILGLSTAMETFIEDPSKKGTYIVGSTEDVGVSSLTSITDDDTAVDSYALSAVGGGTGYVSVIVGNGEAFTPAAESVSVLIFKVSDPLYRGELKVIASANPLDEKLTLRHSGDFAGKPEDYEFAWITGQPVSGLAPTLYNYAPTSILADTPTSTWTLLNNPEEGYETIRGFGYDESTLTSVGRLNSNIVIDDGNGSAESGVTLPHAVLREEFTLAGDAPLLLYASIVLSDNDGAVIYINGAEVAVHNVPGREDTGEVSLPATIAGIGGLVFSVAPEVLQENNTITLDLYTESDSGSPTRLQLSLDGLAETAVLSQWTDVTSGAKSGLGETAKTQHLIQGASIFTLTDNYFSMRYRAKAGTPAAFATNGDGSTAGEWSRWMQPQLAEGWIKRALAGINPFDQRITDLLNNEVATNTSLLTEAGTRWEGDIALNLENIDDFGLIEIYETILRRGKGLSIDGAPAFNVPAANDALLLAAGYLSDLYVLLGNEAYADAANPTIAYSTDSGLFGTSAQFGELNTALFAFKGQLASVLEEELALLRGRDDSLQPTVQLSPVYNRMLWNFTNGIDSGQAVYALNYNIKDIDASGSADATDAAVQYPQGHGDAYGHYLMAIKGYYTLLTNPNFGWEPRIEAVSVLGQPVNVDYQDERKFALAAASLARASSEIVDLTYRQQFTSSESAGWEHLRDAETNSNTGTTRYWGTDEWACRAGQGAYFHWVTANSILPENDTVNTGIQKVDRTTVPELDELVLHAQSVQQSLENADNKLNPLGLANGALSFDISPSEVDDGKTHFEQVYERAVSALGNAKFAFDNAKNSTELIRRQEDSTDERQYAIDTQELAYENQLIELYGTPYSDDIGPGRTYVQGYEGPDLIHYAYVDSVELFFTAEDSYGNEDDEVEGSPPVLIPLDPSLTNVHPPILNYDLDADGELDSEAYGSFNITARGELIKPPEWIGSRAHPGQIQAAVSDVLTARIQLRQAADDYIDILGCMADVLDIYQIQVNARVNAVNLTASANQETFNLESGIIASEVASALAGFSSDVVGRIAESVEVSLPKILGFSNDATSGARGFVIGNAAVIQSALELGAIAADTTASTLSFSIDRLSRQLEIDLESAGWTAENRQMLRDLQNEIFVFQDQRAVVDEALRNYDQTQRKLDALIGKGNLIQKEREIFRKRAAAITQGNRTRDFAFRTFRDEALEKYKTLFDLAARYAYLAARAYDYETGLLDSSGSSAATRFFDDIVQSRALGVVDSEGAPQFSASTNGDPGLAGVMAQLAGDWSVAKSRLGFNNPDRYQTTFSLREEKFRIASGTAGDRDWTDKLAGFVKSDLLDDPDVARYCMQIADANGEDVPGIVIPFKTTILDGANFFGNPLAGGDHGFSPTSFATKIRSSGIAFKGYVGMDSPTNAEGSVTDAGANSPLDPGLGFLNDNSLSATPYIYLIPAGVDSMRSPPLGDQSYVRSWSVNDQAVPLPYNIANTDFSTASVFNSADSLSESPFIIRKHQAFRAVPSGTVFSSSEGFTNSRLIGRSAWNSNWKIVIPGKTLLANPNEGLQRFIESVTDVELFLETYSYSGN